LTIDILVFKKRKDAALSFSVDFSKMGVRTMEDFATLKSGYFGKRIATKGMGEVQ